MSNLIRDGIICTNNIYGIPFKVDLIPSNNRYRRLGIRTLKEYITNHNTGNSNEKADEGMHTKWVDKNIGYINWHFTIGADCIYQELPIYEPAYHAGDGGKGKGNYNSIGMEIVEVPKSKWNQIRLNAIKMNIFLMNNLDNLIGDNWSKTIVPHQKWTGKYCPRKILSESGGFNKFVNDCIELNKTINMKHLLSDNNSNTINITKLEKKIKYNVYDKYWKEGFNNGTLNRIDIMWLINKLAGSNDINKSLDIFIKNGWSNDKEYWLSVVNGRTKYKRTFLNTIVNRAIN